jgi:hypothetical protein
MMEYNSAIKKNEIISFVGKWMELEIIQLSEINQTEKDKYHMLSHICGISSLKMNDKNVGVSRSGMGKDERRR